MDYTPSLTVQVEEGKHSKGEGRWDRRNVHILLKSQQEGKVFTLETVQDIEKTTTSMPIVVMLPSILGPIFCGEEKTSWELHRIVKS